jgi:hypothetical protein
MRLPFGMNEFRNYRGSPCSPSSTLESLRILSGRLEDGQGRVRYWRYVHGRAEDRAEFSGSILRVSGEALDLNIYLTRLKSCLSCWEFGGQLNVNGELIKRDAAIVDLKSY